MKSILLQKKCHIRHINLQKNGFKCWSPPQLLLAMRNNNANRHFGIGGEKIKLLTNKQIPDVSCLDEIELSSVLVGVIALFVRLKAVALER